MFFAHRKLLEGYFKMFSINSSMSRHCGAKEKDMKCHQLKNEKTDDKYDMQVYLNRFLLFIYFLYCYIICK